jgi:hypothetical protein
MHTLCLLELVLYCNVQLSSSACHKTAADPAATLCLLHLNQTGHERVVSCLQAAAAFGQAPDSHQGQRAQVAALPADTSAEKQQQQPTVELSGQLDLGADALLDFLLGLGAEVSFVHGSCGVLLHITGAGACVLLLRQLLVHS